MARLEHGQLSSCMTMARARWTAASDFAVGLAGLVGRTETLGEAFHITSDEVLTWNQIYAEIVRAAGLHVPEILKVPTEFACQVCPVLRERLPADKAEPAIFDNAKIKRFVPEFECRKNFRTGIAESVAWFRADPSRQRIRHRNRFENNSAVCAAWQARGILLLPPRISPAAPSEIRHCSWSFSGG